MNRSILLTAAASLLLASAAPAAAPAFDTPARVAYLIDLSSGAVLYAKNADGGMPPTSGGAITVAIATHAAQDWDWGREAHRARQEWEGFL